jgi:hypothetical protein
LEDKGSKGRIFREPKMNTVRIAIIVAFSASAAAAHAQSADPFYRLPQPYTSGIVPQASAGEAKLKLQGKSGSVSLGLFEGAAEGPSERLLEYVDPDIERKVGNFSRESVRSASVLESLEPGRFERRNRAWGMSVGFNAGPLAVRAAHRRPWISATRWMPRTASLRSMSISAGPRCTRLTAPTAAGAVRRCGIRIIPTAPY